MKKVLIFFFIVAVAVMVMILQNHGWITKIGAEIMIVALIAFAGWYVTLLIGRDEA